MDRSQEKYYKNFERPPFAPTYEPNEDDFKDPIAYVNKIRPVAEKYGIIKIKPPASFQPPFAIDLDKFEFTPRVQKLNELEALSRVKINFLNKVASYWHLQGAQFRFPVVDNKFMDLYKLHKVVASFGGFKEVCEQKKWQAITKKLGYKPQFSTAIRVQYQKVLLPFDQSGLLSRQNSSSSLNGHSKNSDKTDEMCMMKGRRRVPEQQPSTAAITTTQILKPPVVRGGRMMAGLPLMKTQQNTTACPIPKKKPNNDDPIENVLCYLCQDGDDEELLLLCENCDDSYHTYCLSPPLTAVPKGDWRCPKCVSEVVCKLDEGYGFEQSQRTYNLKSFELVASKFKSDYFGIPLEMVDVDSVEREFWRNAIDFESNVSVKYGADLFTDEVGSGFPRLKDSALDAFAEQYAKHPWNLNNLPVLQNSILSRINVDISGMMVPWVYVGMCFSTFCWHTEDHWSFSINYLHWGEKKIWYGVPGEEGDLFETAMKELAPELFEKQPDLLHHIVTIMNPCLLIDKGVTVSTLHQNAGEFVITFPRAYHAGFNEGYNFAEAVNFAPSNWLCMGRQCIDHYSLMRRYCVFSHEELVCGMAKVADQLDIEMAIAVYQDMHKMVSKERDDRKQLLEIGISDSKREIFEQLNDDQRQCSVCKTTCYISALVCLCNPEKMVCLRHITELCTVCPPTKFILKYRYTLDELPPLMRTLLERTKCFDLWIAKVKTRLNSVVTDENGQQREKPAVEELKQLMEEAKVERLPHCESMEALLKTVKHADRCSGIAEQLISQRIRTRNRQHALSSFSKKLKLTEVEAFVEQINKLPCKIPQHDTVLELVRKVREFCVNASEMAERVKSVEHPRDIVAELRDLFEQGLSFDLQLEDILTLKQELERVEWLLSVDEIVDFSSETSEEEEEEEHSVKTEQCELTIASDSADYKNEPDSILTKTARKCGVPLERLRSLINDGLSLEANSQTEKRLASLHRLHDEAQAREETAYDLLNGTEKRCIDQAERTLAEFRPSPVVCGRAVEQLTNVLCKAKEWVEKFDNAVMKGGRASLTEQLLAQSRQLPFDLEPRLSDLRKDRLKFDDFVSQVERLFKKQPSYHSTADIIMPRRDFSELLEGQHCPLYPRRKCSRLDEWNFAEDHDSTATLTEALNRMAEQEAVMLFRLRECNNAKKVSSDGLEEICICRGPASSSGDGHSEDLILCRVCLDSFHAACVSCDQAVRHLDGVYLCPRCVRGGRPSIESVKTVLKLIQGTSIPSLEAVMLQHLLSRAENWQSMASKLLDEVMHENAFEWKSHLDDLLVSGLTIEISSELLEKVAQLNLQVNPLTDNQKSLLESIRDRQTMVSQHMDIPLFLKAEKNGKRRSHSPHHHHQGGRRKSKKVYHDDEQRCSAISCYRPIGDNVSWVQCESGCEKWFHILCVGLTVQMATDMDSYVCFRCRPPTNHDNQLKIEV